MLRRCVREISSARLIARKPRHVQAQAPFFLSSRSEFSSTSQKNSFQKPASPEETSGSGKNLSKLVIGTALVGAAAVAAYQTGYIDLQVKNAKTPNISGNADAVQSLNSQEHISKQPAAPGLEEPSLAKPNMDLGTPEMEVEMPKMDVETPKLEVEITEKDQHEESETNNRISSEDKTIEDIVSSSENNLSSFPESSTSNLDEPAMNSEVSNEDNGRKPGLEEKVAPTDSVAGNQEVDRSLLSSEEFDTKKASLAQNTTTSTSKDAPDETTTPKSLIDSYTLDANEDTSEKRENIDALAAFFVDKEDFVTKSENIEHRTKADDEKLLLGFIEAIHTAEKRQAERDSYIFTEEKRKLKENYEKALKDARARELMYAEEAAILEKELNKEKAKAAAAIKSLEEKAEQKLQEELQRKEEEADIELKKAQELAKAELAAAIAREKSSQIEKIAEADLNINALCMAFYARSEEARQTHSVHKLALGTLALEDALSRGVPIREEVDKLNKSLDGIDRDSLIELALSSLPEEALKSGTYTYAQLNQKFDALKGILRHYSLIPAGGGGLLTHAVAHVASLIKLKEDPSGDGIESVISKVENLLVEGNVAEAADALEGGVRGSEAEEVIAEWVKQARYRAVVQQTVTLLQSYATSITFT